MHFRLQTEINKYAKAAYPNEACGFVVKVGDALHIVDCQNTSEDPQHRFMIAPIEYLKCARQGQIVGVWHSHVNIESTPSDADRAACENSELPWYVTSVKCRGHDFEYGPLTTITPCGFEMPYVGRPYTQGVFDCYSLVRDYYAREFSVSLSNPVRIDRFWEKSLNLFGEGWASEGFQEQIQKDPQIGDVFLIQTEGSIPNHLALYLGDDIILHHCHDRLSRRDVYSGYWSKHTVCHLRHKTLCSPL